MTKEFVMKQALPVETIIYEENCQTIIDLLFATSALTVNIIKCDTKNDFKSGSNHLPILTKLELAMIESISTTRRNFNKLNADTLRETLVRIMVAKKCLYTLSKNDEDLINECIDYQVAVIIDSIQTVINEFTSTIRMSSRSKLDFISKYKKAQRRYKSLKRR